jgi:hypothetical protein
MVPVPICPPAPASSKGKRVTVYLANYGCIVPYTDTGTWYKCSGSGTLTGTVLPAKILVSSTFLLSCFVVFASAAFWQANQLEKSCWQLLNPSALFRHSFGLVWFGLVWFGLGWVGLVWCGAEPSSVVSRPSCFRSWRFL